MVRTPKKIVLLGGSAGGVEAIGAILGVLDADTDAAFFVVIHLNPSVPSLLPQVLARRTRLRVMAATDRASINAGVVYVAPPDRHLVIHDGMVRLGRGPRENGFRPAVDPLLRTAAAQFGSAVIGVIVSGNLDDGTVGLLEVKRQGGTAIVQDPDEAAYAGMPASALQEVAIDHVLPLSAIGEKISVLVREAPPEPAAPVNVRDPDIAIGGEAPVASIDERNSRPARLGCPECGGVLWESNDDEIARYRCRVGHAFSDEGLLAAQTETLETALWSALRTLQESEEHANTIAERMDRRGHAGLAERFRRQADDAQKRAQIVRQALVSNQASTELVRDAD